MRFVTLSQDEPASKPQPGLNRVYSATSHEQPWTIEDSDDDVSAAVGSLPVQTSQQASYAAENTTVIADSDDD